MKMSLSPEISFGYGSNLQNDIPQGEFLIQISKKNDLMKGAESLSQALCNRFIEIKRLTNRNIHIFLSGGIDSEVVAISALQTGVKAEFNIMRFAKDLNQHDIFAAERFCKSAGITPKYIEIDPVRFFENESHLSYAKFGCASPLLALQMWMTNQVNGIPILAGSSIRLRKIDPFFLSDLPTPSHFAFDRMWKEQAREGVSQMLISSSDLIEQSLLASLDRLGQENSQSHVETYQKLYLKDTNYYAESFREWIDKYHFFREQAFSLLPRPTKFTGFERVHYYFGGGDMSVPFEKQSLETQWAGLQRFNLEFRLPMEKLAGKPKIVKLEFQDTQVRNRFSKLKAGGSIKHELFS